MSRGQHRCKETYYGFEIIDAFFDGTFISLETISKAATDLATFVRCLDDSVKSDRAVFSPGYLGMFQFGTSIKRSNAGDVDVHGEWQGCSMYVVGGLNK
jgi:hypothetical protein